MSIAEEIVSRIEKDITIFSINIKRARDTELSRAERRIVDLSEMYAQDSKAWLDKGDYYTSFSSIAYAHGLLDSILKLKNIIE